MDWILIMRGLEIVVAGILASYSMVGKGQTRYNSGVTQTAFDSGVLRRMLGSDKDILPPEVARFFLDLFLASKAKSQ
jgi:hypothetical protein